MEENTKGSGSIAPTTGDGSHGASGTVRVSRARGVVLEPNSGCGDKRRNLNALPDEPVDCFYFTQASLTHSSAASIQAHGLLHNLIVIKTKSDKYEVIVGSCRLAEKLEALGSASRASISDRISGDTGI
jgi:hypothetical protein